MPNLTIVCEIGKADIKIERISGEPRKINGKPIVMKPDGSPKIIYKDPSKTKTLEYKEIDIEGNAINGRSSCYIDDEGNKFQKDETVPYYVTEDETLIEAVKNEKTEVFEVKTWEPIINYLDKYQIDAYYQIIPSSGNSKKDFAKSQAIEANTVELKKIWDYMFKNQVVGRGSFNVTSSGYLPSIGYIRAVLLDDDKWTLELARFKETKSFTWFENLEWKPKTQR